VKRKSLFSCLVAVLAVGILLVSCAKTPTPAQPTPAQPTPAQPTPAQPAPAQPTAEEAITIPWGTASCLSGPYAAWGVEEHNIQEMEVDDINSGGGCWGGILGHEPGFRVNGQLYKWNIIAYDARMDPVEGTKVISKLIYEDHCQFIHIFMDQVYLATRQMLIDNKCLVNIQGDSPDDLGPDNPYTFRCLLSNPEINPKVYSAWIKENLGVKSVGIITEDSEMGRLHGDAYASELSKLGVQILTSEYYETLTTDFSAPLTKIISLKPDMILSPHAPSEEVGLIVKQARELGYKGIIYEGVCPATKTLVDLAGWDNLEGLYSVNAVSPPFPYPQQQWFYNEYTKRYGMDAWSGGLFDRADPIYVMTLAIEKANSLDTEKIAAAWESMTSDELFSFFGPGAYMGGHTLYGNNHILVPRHWVSEITGGKEINKAEIAPPSGL
jgi:branched-chain amino acid transport system substrate-binding protein